MLRPYGYNSQIEIHPKFCTSSWEFRCSPNCFFLYGRSTLPEKIGLKPQARSPLRN
ncbi:MULTISPECIES: hypothetical protein [unclassified Microcoleus]|uniref:hypothetical protein n=1 Tax=unclassified Microcoleus TaxID=2642155 RepID=UPI0025E27C57|nr:MULTISPECIES: hypothetical protein [unclassified Microcoleus]